MPKALELIKCACGCGKEFNKYDLKNRIRKFVSGHNSILNSPHKEEKIKQICKTCGKIYYHRPSLANRGKNTYCSNKCRYVDAYSWVGGNKNVNWKGGDNGVQNLRWAPSYRKWRYLVFKRDRYTCQLCGIRGSRNIIMHAHHKIRFSESIEFRFDVDNGITLCKKCHLFAHQKGEDNASYQNRN